MQIARHGIGVLYLVECLDSTLVVLIEELSEGSAVADGLAEAGLCLCEVTLGNVQIAESFTEAVSTDGVGDVLLCLGKLTVLQGDESLNMFNKNSGLGLSICKAIVDGMNGEISLKSEEGKGTTVTVYFPCRLRDKKKGL